MVPAHGARWSSSLIRPLSVPARRDPDHRSEMVTQWLCGEPVRILEDRDRWIRAAGEDGYAAWVPDSAVFRADGSGTWAATAWSLGTPIVAAAGGRGYLPWGARVRRTDETGLELPGGGAVRALDPDRLVDSTELRNRFPPDPLAVIQTARSWLGVPYLWGGRTNTGCDCSGFVQAVFGLHGIALARDSDQQAEDGEAIAGASSSLSDLRPADLVFFAPEGAGITHVAMAAGGTGILHCSSTGGEVSEDDLSAAGELEELLRGSVVTVRRVLDPAAQPSGGREVRSPQRSA